MELEGILGMLEMGGGHVAQSFRVFLEKHKGADGAGSSGTQTKKKKIPKGARGKRPRLMHTQTLEVSAILVMSEEGQKKRRYKTATLTGPQVKKPKVAKPPRAKIQREEYLLSPSGEPTDLPRAVPADVPDRKAALDAFGPTAAEMDKEVDALISGVIQHSFISETMISLNTLVQEQREKDPSELLVIPMGSDGGMGKILRETQVFKVGVEEVMEEEKGGEMVEYEEREEEMGVGDSPSAARRRKGLKRHKSLFTRSRLRSPSSQMVANYMDALLGLTKRVTRKSMDKLSLKHELACFSRSLTETSVLGGHAIHRVVKVGARQYKMITRLKKEMREWERDYEQMEADIDMITKENQTLENKNVGLQAALEKEREERKKADAEVDALNSRLDKFREFKMKMNTDLDE
ncbi:hypothetical protein Dimus_022389 [Dionaea muscipula]